MLRNKVAVAMSGGVDSSVAALLLKNAGHEVHGIFMRTWNAEDFENPIGECPWRMDLNDASDVCGILGITFEVLNLIAKYRELVVGELVEGCRNGITPNPDVLCNMRIKFGVLKEYARANGFEKFSTGHHCRIAQNADGSVDVLEGADRNKDQSYFLAMLSQEQIKDTLFPIGNFQKSEVRRLARVAGLPNHWKKDSQGICFLGKVKVNDFLTGYIENSPGPIVDADGKILGEHEGLFRFTIGQRHGMNLPSNVDFAHYVVIGKDLQRNQLIVEIEREDSKFLYGREFFVHGLSFTNRSLEDYEKLLARPRYRDPAQLTEFFRTGERTARVIFAKPQRAVTPGQIIALYDNGILLGGGVFS
ncbi:MAG: tRNA 2-thiouridine(34) synthase MnmA [Puniceicoccales bacterium]|jgi:tRNA-specific 2-thiouridylase|nr:tRNA 2-thiouridine(34) synthase MnmA [Puniceicoccales bacterium]